MSVLLESYPNVMEQRGVPMDGAGRTIEEGCSLGNSVAHSNLTRSTAGRYSDLIAKKFRDHGIINFQRIDPLSSLTERFSKTVYDLENPITGGFVHRLPGGMRNLLTLGRAQLPRNVYLIHDQLERDVVFWWISLMAFGAACSGLNMLFLSFNAASEQGASIALLVVSCLMFLFPILWIRYVLSVSSRIKAGRWTEGIYILDGAVLIKSAKIFHYIPRPRLLAVENFVTSSFPGRTLLAFVYLNEKNMEDCFIFNGKFDMPVGEMLKKFELWISLVNGQSRLQALPRLQTSHEQPVSPKIEPVNDGLLNTAGWMLILLGIFDCYMFYRAITEKFGYGGGGPFYVFIGYKLLKKDRLTYVRTLRVIPFILFGLLGFFLLSLFQSYQMDQADVSPKVEVINSLFEAIAANWLGVLGLASMGFVVALSHPKTRKLFDDIDAAGPSFMLFVPLKTWIYAVVFFLVIMPLLVGPHWFRNPFVIAKRSLVNHLAENGNHALGKFEVETLGIKNWNHKTNWRLNTKSGTKTFRIEVNSDQHVSIEGE